MIPPNSSLRIIGDVHGDTIAFSIAAQTDHFVIQLGDLVDEGPDTPGTLKIMFDLIARNRGVFVLGNHDFKLLRALRGDAVTKPPYLVRTIDELTPALSEQAQVEIRRAPAWIRHGNNIFVHGGFHPAMLAEAPPEFPAGRPGPLLARAIYGQTTGRVTGAGKPERLIDWIDEVPAHITVYCGHDRRSMDGRPYVRTGRKGGKTIFLDTGAGKGGHLSWIDIPAPASN